MGASSGLTPAMGVVEQENFYGVDGECLACPGVSVSRKGTKKIEGCECPVSPRLRALPHARTPVRIFKNACITHRFLTLGWSVPAPSWRSLTNAPRRMYALIRFLPRKNALQIL